MTLKEVTHRSAGKNFSISLRWLMILGFGGLVLTSISLVLFMSISTNFSNTFSLLNDRALSLLDNMEQSIHSQHRQAERAVLALADLHENEKLLIGPTGEDKGQPQLAVLEAIMITSPVVEALLIYDIDARRNGIYRTPKGKFGQILYGPDEEMHFRFLAKNLDVNTENPVWGNPATRGNILFHNVGYPLRKNGKVVGYAVATIGQHSLNRIITKLGRENDTTAFILSGDNKVIAHSGMPEFFSKSGSVSLDEFPDHALRQLTTAKEQKQFGKQKAVGQNMEIFESGSRSGNLFIIRKLTGYSSQPYHLGAYFPKLEIGTEVFRASMSAFVGLAALIIAVIASIVMARYLSRPMQRISKVANDFSNLNLDNFNPLPASRIREIDEQANSMNSMHTALSEFSHYVPKALVKRLMEPGSEPIRSVEREITILFTDIVGFTSLTEGLNAIDTAALLNSHFDIVCEEINRHNGTVDKFLGDGLMAFWGAPDADDNQAKNALDAADGILIAIDKQNERRVEAGLLPLRIRIGIHTGRVVVGNIGSADRHNYTLVGDAVNVANRLEQLGRDHIGVGDTIVIVSSATWEAAGRPDNMKALGLQKLRGREAPISTYAKGSEIMAGDSLQNKNVEANKITTKK